MNNIMIRQRGLSLIELMVSVAISVAVLSSLVYVYVGSRGAYRTNEALARVQESGRFALEWISRDLRQAGYMGCFSRGSNVVFYSNPKPAALPTGMGIFGHENGEGFTNPTAVARLRGDVVLVSSLDANSGTVITEDSDVVNANIKIRNNCLNFRADEFLVITDCTRAAVFTVTAVGNSNNCPGGGNSTTLAHAGNKNGGLDTPSHRINPSFRASERAFVTRFNGATGYFIGSNPANRPSLYRFTGTRAEEVVENVEDLDLLFGVDTDFDGAVDAYLNAAAVTAANQWDRVLSVRVSIVAVSTETVLNGVAAQVVYLRDSGSDTVVDAQTAANDRRLRQVFTTTVALRNRLP